MDQTRGPDPWIRPVDEMRGPDSTMCRTARASPICLANLNDAGPTAAVPTQNLIGFLSSAIVGWDVTGPKASSIIISVVGAMSSSPPAEP